MRWCAFDRALKLHHLFHAKDFNLWWSNSFNAIIVSFIPTGQTLDGYSVGTLP